MTDRLLDVCALVKDYPATQPLAFFKGARTRILDEVSLTVDAGETLGLVGESGSGKSTTARVILKLTPATAGAVRIMGQDTIGLSAAAFRPYRAAVQMIFQDPGGAVNPAYRMRTVLEEALWVHRRDMTAKDRRSMVSDLLTSVGLRPEVAERFPHELSGGQLQRVGIARALAVRPRLIIADEPVSALDVTVQAQVLNLMTEVKERHGLAYLFVAHDLAVVKRMSDRVAVMFRGQIMETAPSAEIYKHPAHPYTRLLLDAIPGVRLAAEPSHDEADVPEGKARSRRGCAFASRCGQRVALCHEERPVTREIGPRHTVACHLA